MPPPAPSCARGARRTPTAPRCTPGRGGPRCGPRSPMPVGSTTSRRGRSAASSTAWSCSTPTAASSATRCCGTTRAPRVPPRISSPSSAPKSLAQRTGLVPVASFTITKLRWLRDHEPDNAALVAAVALPHDWLTWRLRGYGPAGESPLGPVLEELTTDRSDASGTGYWNPDSTDPRPAATTATSSRAALGHDAVLPRVLGPHEWVTDAAGRRVGGGAGDNAGAALGLGAGPGDVVRLDRHERHGLRGERAAHDRPDRHGRRLRRLHRSLPAAGRDPERRARARRDRPPARRRSRRAQPARARRRRPAPAASARAVLRGRAHAEPARRHGIPHGHDPRLDHAREPRARRRRGHARRARRRPRGAARPRRAARARAADRRRRAVRGRARHRTRSCSASPSRCPRPASTSPSVPHGRRHPSSTDPDPLEQRCWPGSVRTQELPPPRHLSRQPAS